MLRHSWVVRAVSALSLSFSLLGVANAEPAACVPQCRSGYLCVAAKCVSACNPPCAAGEQCTAQGECLTPGQVSQSVAPLRPAAPAPPPAAAPPPAPAPPPPAAQPQPGGWPAAAPAVAPAPQPAAPPAPPPPAADGWTVPAASTAEVAPEPKHGSLPHTHDGFYLRLGLGVGYLTGGLSSSNFASEGIDDMSSSGVGILGEFSIGGTLAPGLVLGGGSFSTSVPSNTVTVKSGGTSLDFSGSSVSVASIGPFVDYYFDPTGGMHAEAAILLSSVSASKGTVDQSSGYTFPPDDYSGIGYGVMLGFGYEGWVSDQWSIGGLARLTYTAASLDPNNGGDTIDASFWTPGALLTLTYH